MPESAFQQILGRLEEADGGVTEKTASNEEAPTAPDAGARMLQTVRSVTQALRTKTANAQQPEKTVAGDLERMAKQAQAAEQELMTKQAHMLGAAVFDGFMERFAQYDAALEQSGHKTAAAAAPTEEYIQKVAEAAYAQAIEDMQKQAAAEKQRGFDNQMAAVHKIASDTHHIAQGAARDLLAKARQQS